MVDDYGRYCRVGTGPPQFGSPVLTMINEARAETVPSGNYERLQTICAHRAHAVGSAAGPLAVQRLVAEVRQARNSVGQAATVGAESEKTVPSEVLMKDER